MPVNRTCPQCGVGFALRQRLYCSAACANAARRRQVSGLCSQCGTAFTVKQSARTAGAGKYCSRACYVAHGAETPLDCAHCGAAFTASRARRTNGAKYCSRACYVAARIGTKARRPSTQVERQCVGCGSTFLVYPSVLKSGPAIWCSPACRYSTPGWAAVLKPGQRKHGGCLTCAKPFEVVMSRVGRYCSKACVGIANGKRQVGRDASKRTMKTCLECGASFEAWIKSADRQKFCSKSCNARWWCHRRRVLRPTSIEIALEAALSESGVTTVREMRTGRFSIDLAVPAARIAIEADGTYWHSLPKQMAADARKNAALAAEGWTVLRFGEDQINGDIASCVATVLEALDARQ